MDNKNLFRQESLARISSPETLHDYLRVTGPRLWMLLSAILVLLVGFLVFASTATLESTMPVRVSVSTGADGRHAVRSTLPLSEKDRVQTGMALRLGGERGSVSLISIGEGEETDPAMLVVYEMEHPNLPLPDGEYDGQLVLEAATPISFLWN